MSSVCVLKLGGELLRDEQAIAWLAQRIAHVPSPLVLVHGGGAQITELATQLGIESTLHNGRRITTKPMLRVVTMVAAGWLNKALTSALLSAGMRAVGIAALDGGCITAQRRTGSLEWGYVGDPIGFDITLLNTLLQHGFTPVIAPITWDARGTLLNTNADTIAATIAKGFARQGWDAELVLCTPAGGVLDRQGTRIDVLRREEYERYCQDGTISGGMLPKLDAAWDAVHGGVHAARIISAAHLPAFCGTTIVEDTTQ